MKPVFLPVPVLLLLAVMALAVLLAVVALLKKTQCAAVLRRRGRMRGWGPAPRRVALMPGAS